MSDIKQITCKSVKSWRNWLEKNHMKEERVMLVRFKKISGKPSFNQSQAMNEAICFGWIDTTINRIDDHRYGVKFVKRKKSSRWSDNTFARAKELIKQKKMSPFGLKMYKLGLKKPSHDHGIPKNPDMPEELKKELDRKKNSKAKKYFESRSPSYKKMIYRWLLSGKREETRMKRVRIIIEKSQEEKRLY